MSGLWTEQAFLSAIDGDASGLSGREITGISIDSRTLTPGDAFFAITGDRHDGHKFVASALEKGAALAVVSHDYEGDGALLRVADTLDALYELAKAARKRSKAHIVAVTGSVGKTGSKEALRLALSASGSVHVSDKSYNNHWGVPLSLARMPSDAKFGVFEIGMNHPGEITPLSRLVRPHVALITTIEPVHIGYLGSMDAIASAKAEIFDGLKKDGVAVLNRDNQYFDFLAEKADEAGAKIVSFGEHKQASVRLKGVELDEENSSVSADVCGHDVSYKLGAPGKHLVINSLGVLAVAHELGADVIKASRALAGLAPAEGRGGRIRLICSGGEAVLIDESYNANPASMRAALSLLANTRTGNGGRRIAVLGDMLELGDQAQRLHEELAEEVKASGADLVFASGPNMAHFWKKLPKSIRGLYAQEPEGIESSLLEQVHGGDVIMIKGSLASRMGMLAGALKVLGK